MNSSPCCWSGHQLRFEGKLFNCALIIYRGRLLGIVPKTYIPNYREFYEKRQFNSGRNAVKREVSFLGELVPFGNDLIFDATNYDDFSIHVEICEDLWTPIPPSTYAALAGATVLANLSASNITIGKADYRRDLCASQSGRCIAAYLYSAAGPGESTTDLAWDGHAIIYENDELLAESERFSSEEQIVVADIDLERLAQDRMRLTSFNDVVADHRERVQRVRRVPFEFQSAGRRHFAPTHCGAFSLCSERLCREGREVLRGLQHPGACPHETDAERRRQAHRHWRFRWP